VTMTSATGTAKTPAEPWTRMIRSTGVIGLGTIVLLFTSIIPSPLWASHRLYALVSGVMLPAYLLPYFAFWVWVIIICIRLFWRPDAVLGRTQTSGRL
jgi:hypothetical protein